MFSSIRPNAPWCVDYRGTHRRGPALHKSLTSGDEISPSILPSVSKNRTNLSSVPAALRPVSQGSLEPAPQSRPCPGCGLHRTAALRQMGLVASTVLHIAAGRASSHQDCRTGDRQTPRTNLGSGAIRSSFGASDAPLISRRNLPRLLHRIHHHLGRLPAGDAELAVNDEERHAGDPGLLDLLDHAQHLGAKLW